MWFARRHVRWGSLGPVIGVYLLSLGAFYRKDFYNIRDKSNTCMTPPSPVLLYSFSYIIIRAEISNENFIQRIRMKAEVKKWIYLLIKKEAEDQQEGLPSCLIFIALESLVLEGFLFLTDFSYVVLFVTLFCSIHPLIMVSVVTFQGPVSSFPFPSYMYVYCFPFLFPLWMIYFPTLGWTYLLWTL